MDEQYIFTVMITLCSVMIICFFGWMFTWSTNKELKEKNSRLDYEVNSLKSELDDALKVGNYTIEKKVLEMIIEFVNLRRASNDVHSYYPVDCSDLESGIE